MGPGPPFPYRVPFPLFLLLGLVYGKDLSQVGKLDNFLDQCRRDFHSSSSQTFQDEHKNTLQHKIVLARIFIY